MLVRRAVVALVAVAATVPLGACAGSEQHRVPTLPETTVRASMPAACTLLSRTDAQRFLGAAARVERTPTARTEPGADSCSYGSERPPQVLLLRATTDTSVFSPVGLAGASPVSVGEDAFVTKDAAGSITLQFRQRGVVVTLLYSDLRRRQPGAAPDREADLTALGGTIAARL